MMRPLLPATEPAVDIDDVSRLIDTGGHRVHDPLLEQWVGDVDAGALRDLYRDMAVVRRIDAEGVALQRQGQLGLWAPCRGQEAVQVGTARAVRTGDFLFPSYRETGVAYVRGAAPADLMRMWRGEEHSGWDPHAIGVAAAQLIIGAQSLHAVGYAMGIQRDGGDDVAVAYFGDGATSEGDVSEALVFAASFQAPVVFVCSNNQWAISEPVRVQTRGSLAARATGFGIACLRVDGNDVLACLAAMRWALERARSGESPAFIEAVTYRMGPHTTSDDPTRYRDAGEVERWAARDPLMRLEALLRREDAFDDAFAAEVAREADRVAAEVRAETIGMVSREAIGVFDGVYAEPHPGLDEERARYAAYLAGFADESAGGAL